MASQIDDRLLDAIVAGVLDRLRSPSAPAESPTSRGHRPSEVRPSNDVSSRGADAGPAEPLVVADRVVTEATLAAKFNGAKSIRFAPKAVLTPSARDFLRLRGIEWSHGPAGGKAGLVGGRWAALVVRHTSAVDRVLAELLPGARKELLGCPDDAAKLAVAEIARGGFANAVILAEQTHRAAGLANRHPAVKAAAVRDAAEVAAVKKQWRANVWCLDPTGRGGFELRNLVKAVLAD